jgi:hypothetical protein
MRALSHLARQAAEIRESLEESALSLRASLRTFRALARKSRSRV